MKFRVSLSNGRTMHVETCFMQSSHIFPAEHVTKGRQFSYKPRDATPTHKPKPQPGTNQ